MCASDPGRVTSARLLFFGNNAMTTASLIKCGACGKAISANARACPECGEPQKASANTGGKSIGRIIGLLMIVVGAGFAFTASDLTAAMPGLIGAFLGALVIIACSRKS